MSLCIFEVRKVARSPVTIMRRIKIFWQLSQWLVEWDGMERGWKLETEIVLA